MSPPSDRNGVSNADQNTSRSSSIPALLRPRSGTHGVGAALVAGDWSAAIQLVMQPTILDPDSTPARRAFLDATASPAEILSRAPPPSPRTPTPTTPTPPSAVSEGGTRTTTFTGLPRQAVAERAILSRLAQDPQAPVDALLAIPKNLRRMYIHAYQSYLWNLAVTNRLEGWGNDTVVAGDLVLLPREEEEEEGE